MITREADYCIRSILFLSKPEHLGKPVSANQLAESMRIPYRFLRKITTNLVAAGLLKSQRGRNGGLTLTKAPDNITLLEVLQKADVKGILLNICLSGDTQCPRERICKVHNEIGKLQVVLDNNLKKITFNQLV